MDRMVNIKAGRRETIQLMKVFFDHQIFSHQLFGGISRYFCELINGINHNALHEAHLSLMWSNNAHLREYNINRLKYPFPEKHRLLQTSNQVFNYLDFKTSHNDIYHATYFNDFMHRSVGSKPYVVTFYDMVYERLSHKFTELSGDTSIIYQKKTIAQRASHLIAISENTKQDMVELLGIPPEKITVIYLGSSFTTNPSEVFISKKTAEKPYLLYVGNRSGYKNFSAFLKASAELLKRYQMSIVCAGGGKFNSDEMSLIKLLSLTELVRQIPINDDILPDLYRKATAFVFPSLYEGFGIPILEAFSCNCPCVVSNNSSLSEVAGDAALYINPSDYESIVDGLERIINDKVLSSVLVQRGRERLTRFSWSNTVEQTLKLYESLV